MNWDELKRLAEESLNGCEVWYEQDGFLLQHADECDRSFMAAANPKAILALIADNERLSGECEGCPMSIAADLAKERDQIKSENERLNSCLKWEQNRAERIGTHGSGCESWGPIHYECLLRERDQLKAECEALRRDIKLAREYLQDIVDGESWWDIQGNTGLSEDHCKAIIKFATENKK